jgi:hypothetical protein
MELGKLLGFPFGNKVSCDPKDLMVKGGLMVVKVLSVMERARRRRPSRGYQPNSRRRNTMRKGFLYADEGGKQRHPLKFTNHVSVG